ncbi:MAG: UDP-3-O-(3-hydroxymyristoyl)glucosamine N-acyltransferase [Opitutales bacterium]|jgi:UDP-3-O-[3-hydroxymyristoyl] glucosamine N-acyltransferase
MKWRLSVDEILRLLDSDRVIGSFPGEVSGLADLREAKEGDLSFLSGGKYSKYLEESGASVVLVPGSQEGEPPDHQAWIPVKDPSRALAVVCSHIEKKLLSRPPEGIHPTAIVDPSANLAPGVAIGPNCIIGESVTIGKGTVLDSNVRIDRGATVGEDCRISHGALIGWGCRVGNRCRLFPGSVIGMEGFGYHSDQNGHTPIPQIGIVVLEDDVDLGANSCIDRARFAETRIREGTKIDNLVQIGHNCIIGKHCILCAQVGMAGSTELGNFVVLAGQVGVAGHLKVGDGVTGTAQCGITKDIPPGIVVSETPAQPHRETMKLQVRIRQLPELFRRVKALEEGRS